MASLLEFINRVRTLRDLPELGAIEVAGAEPDDDENCILARALDLPVRATDEASGDHAWIMCFDQRLEARRVGIVMGLVWNPDPPAVTLPDALIDLCVSEHFGFVDTDELGFLKCWWVRQGPDDTDLYPLAPTDDVVDGGHWHLPPAR